MKKLVGLLILAAALSVSCEHQDIQSLSQRKAVNFTTTVGTKTSYSGQVVNQKEAINWTDGDTFTITCAQATPSSATYKVTAPAGIATAVTPNTPADEITWGDGAHTFYAAYPAGHLTGNVLDANIPSSQTVTRVSDGVYAPSLSSLGYMVAAATANPEAESVQLVFKPVFSTLEFTVGPGENEDVVIKDFTLVADSNPIAGGCQATLSVDSDPVISTSNPSTVISVTFAGGNVTVNRGQTLTFSVIALPKSLTGLKARFKVGDETKEFELKTADGPISFTAGKKSRINAPAILGPEAVAAGITAVIDDQGVDDYTITVE